MDTYQSPAPYSLDFPQCGHLAAFRGDEIADLFAAALRRAGATIVKGVCHDFPGVGLTSVLILSESHAVLHTWPETGTVNIDIFSCSTRLKSLDAVNELGGFLGARHITVQEIPRADGNTPGVPAHARP